MTQNLKKISSHFPTTSTAQIISRTEVEVTAPDGEVFIVRCPIGNYTNKDTQEYELKWLESTFDEYFSDNKEQMIDNIWRICIKFGICGGILGISSGTRYQDRIRIGSIIREIREQRGIEAKDLAKLAGIDAANLSRIENGKYSVGLDILSKIAASLGKKIELVDL